MPTTFKRVSADAARLRRVEERARIVAGLSRQPTVEATCTATTPSRPSRHRATPAAPSGRARSSSRKTSIKRGTGGARTAAENIVIFRSWRARGRKLGLGAADVKGAIKATLQERIAAKTTTAGLAMWAGAIGPLMVAAIKRRIRAEGLVDTEQLVNSITFRTKNI